MIITLQVQWLIAIAAGYLCGSIPVGYLIGRARGVDLRAAGSGNIGATTAGRVLGRKMGVICFVLDMIKGAGPVAAAGAWFGLMGRRDILPGEMWAWLGVGVAAVIGHMFPIWLGFRGGKGISTSFGVLLGVWPFLTLPAIGTGLTWLLFTAVFRYVSLASVMAAATLPFYVWAVARAMGWPMRQTWPLVIVTVVIGLLAILRHRSNMARLWRGIEPRLR